jgi:Holliday junction resolvase RusA-like endonuclease
MGIAENTIKNKNDKIKESIITVDYEKVDDNHYIYKINIDQLIEPQMRPRSGKFRNIYDPMKTYKEVIRKKILTEIDLKNIPCFLGEEYSIKSYISLTSKPLLSWSISKQYNALNGYIPFNKKPDIDNCAKTIYDSLEKIFFNNDSEIISENIEKKYGLNNNIDEKVDNEEIKNFLLERMK